MTLHDLQLICIGAMLVLTPSMLVVAVLLMRAPTIEGMDR